MCVSFFAILLLRYLMFNEFFIMRRENIQVLMSCSILLMILIVGDMEMVSRKMFIMRSDDILMRNGTRFVDNCCGFYQLCVISLKLVLVIFEMFRKTPSTCASLR